MNVRILSLLTFCIIFILGCASGQKGYLEGSLDDFSCPIGDLKGKGVGKSEQESLISAQAEIARQIKSSIESTQKISDKQYSYNGKLSESSSYESDIRLLSSLINAQDAKPSFRARQGEQVGVVVCMSKVDAAKPFLEKEWFFADSLFFASQEALLQTHPLKKEEAWRKGRSFYYKIFSIRLFINDLGAPSSDFVESAKIEYNKMRADHQKYCADYKLVWEGSGSEGDVAVFSKLSQRIKLEKSGQCKQGLRLALQNTEPNCFSNSFGTHCTFAPDLIGYSCSGEEYFSLRVIEPMIGSDSNSKNTALRYMWMNTKTEPFVEKWIQELEPWVPLCGE